MTHALPRIVSTIRAPLAAFGLALLLAACAGDDEEAYVERPVGDIYNEAMDHLEAGRYIAASTSFDEVERQHPYSKWATKAQIMSAYAHYERAEYDDAILALDRFIEIHPGNKDVAYAYYLKGLSYYEQISDVARDQRMTEGALATFKELVSRFPGSEYARDARLKIDLAEDHLAGKDMNVGRFYLRAGHHLAAIGRFRRVIEEYGTTTHVPEALLRLTEAYLELGIIDEARYTAAVLGHNYPNSEWYLDTYTLLAGEGILTAEEVRLVLSSKTPDGKLGGTN